MNAAPKAPLIVTEKLRPLGRSFFTTLDGLGVKTKNLILVAGLLLAAQGGVATASNAGKKVQYPEFTSFEGNSGQYTDQSSRPFKVEKFSSCSVKRSGNQLSITVPGPRGTHTVTTHELRRSESKDNNKPWDKNEGSYELYFAPPQGSGANVGFMTNYKKGKRGGQEYQGVILVKSASVALKSGGKVFTVVCELQKK